MAHAFEWGKVLNVICREKLAGKWANGLKIDDSEKIGPPGSVCPHPGAIYMYITVVFKDLLL